MNHSVLIESMQEAELIGCNNLFRTSTGTSMHWFSDTLWRIQGRRVVLMWTRKDCRLKRRQLSSDCPSGKLVLSMIRSCRQRYTYNTLHITNVDLCKVAEHLKRNTPVLWLCLSVYLLRNEGLSTYLSICMDAFSSAMTTGCLQVQVAAATVLSTESASKQEELAALTTTWDGEKRVISK